VTQASQPAPPIARLAQIEDGGFLETEARLDGDDESLILHRQGDTVRAWLNVCPHAGRRLDWAPGKFLRDKHGHLVCAVHGATFELIQGECVAGPCRGALLKAVAVAVEDGDIRLART
jgi:nitrite reductase/ring-hydroxylating ferredoxin subunit